MYRNLGELERAKEYHIQAREIRERKTLSTTYCSRVYQELGELERAKATYHILAIEIQKEKLRSTTWKTTLVQFIET